MIAVTPEGMFTAQQFKVLRDAARTAAMGSSRGSTSQNLVTRPLLPSDLYGASARAVFSNQVAIAGANAATLETGLARVPASTAWAVFGYAVQVASPAIQEIWIGDGSATYAKIRLAPLYAQGSARPRVGYFDPIYFPATQVPVFTFIANAAVAANAEVFELIGIVAETPTNVRTQTPISSSQAPGTLDG